MNISLAYLKKFLKFGILLVGIQSAGLQNGFGAYTPSSLKWYDYAAVDLWYTDRSWLQHNLKISDAAIGQCIVPSAMVDANGILYTVHLVHFDYSKGACFSVQKRDYGAIYDSRCEIYPWNLVGNVDSCGPLFFDYLESDYSSAEDIFKNYIHNAFHPCIIQEVDKESLDYLYVYFYIPPAFFLGKNYNNAGILMVKLNKSDLSIVSHEFQSSDHCDAFNFHYLRPRTISGRALGSEWGNFQGWADYYRPESNRTHLLWTIGADERSQAGICHRIGVNYPYAFPLPSPNLGTSSFSRFLKVNDYIYTINYCSGCKILRYNNQDDTYPPVILDMGNLSASIEHNSQGFSEPYTAKHYDFCIVDNEGGNPIFCVLGLRSTHETDSSNTSLSGATNERWTSKCINEPSKIVLMLSSYAWDGNSDTTVSQTAIAEDPQNIIYSTGQTSFTTESCSTICGCHPADDSTYYPEQLFKNTHKLVAYTSESGNKYIIYCYCYPGKSKQLFLGYAPYYISNNKVHLFTKTEFKSPNNTMGESFGSFTSCSRIISMDLKNGKLWITWMDADDMYYYCFHIAAKDLVGE